MAGHSVPVDFRVNPAKISNPGKEDYLRCPVYLLFAFYFRSKTSCFSLNQMWILNLKVVLKPDLIFSGEEDTSAGLATTY